MPKQLSLNELYARYSSGKLEKRQFEGLLFELILDDLSQYNLFGWGRDDCIDYLAWFYPRLSRAVDSYKNIGASFESYINTIIRFSSREYHFRLTNRNAAEYAAWTVKIPEMYVHVTEPDYQEHENSAMTELKTELKQVKNPRQLLILSLKCYYYLSDDFLDRLAPRVGMESRNLKQMVDTLRKQRIKRDEESLLMRERIHSQFYRCIIYEKKLKVLSGNSAAYLKQKLKLEKARERLDTMRKRYAGIRHEATNLQVAKILGIPKGTVDSNLHALRNRLKKGK
jgi:hypothetical protein